MIGPYYVNTEARRQAAWGPVCKVPFGSVGLAGKTYKVHRDTVAAWRVFDEIRARHDYVPTGTDTGFFNCRHIGGDPRRPWSSHAWATALDLNWLQNPDGKRLVTDMPAAMIRELQATQTKSGAYVWMWGGDWDRDPATGHTYYDAMHWETIAHPLDLATGFQHRPPLEADMGLSAGDRSGLIAALQRHLNDWRPDFNLTVDGIFGTSATSGGTTGAALAVYQLAAGQLVDPLHCDDITFAALATNAFRNPATLKTILDRLET